MKKITLVTEYFKFIPIKSLKKDWGIRYRIGQPKLFSVLQLVVCLMNLSTSNVLKLDL